ncbi:winged helix-turn-helix domain-containing protein [Thermococcus sp. 21S7]|uniref:winged helix-turn-helix domain-containing protein n=1 Tax=Thermococcus sp. 21S7 TaxID=1638221 RepID=UPI00143AE71A|nr:winged helix-turn-helix domain-containing protein [Thermococcus sp. 21S7]NJE60547.1 ArsR family transcriptional regulator [Thermococcus sp. 21S7]
MTRLEDTINFVPANEYNKISSINSSHFGLQSHYSAVRHHFVVYFSYSSTYIYDVLEFLSRHLIKALVRNVINSRDKIREIEQWRYIGETRKNGKKYYLFLKKPKTGELQIVLEAPPTSVYKSNWMKDSIGILPVIIKGFKNDQDPWKERPQWTVTVGLIYKNTIDTTYTRAGYIKSTMRIDRYDTYYPLDILNAIRDLPNRPIDYTYRLKRIKLLTPELYVRFPRYTIDKDGRTVDNLLKMNRLLNELRERNGIRQHVISEGDVNSLDEHGNVVDIIWKGHEFRLKLYTSKLYPHRDPKLEVIVRDKVEISRNELHPNLVLKKLDALRERLNIASGILGAIMAFMRISPRWDPVEDYRYLTQKLLVDKEFLGYLWGTESATYLASYGQHLAELDKLDYQILKITAERTFIKVPILAKILSKSESTIRRRLKKLERLGYISATKGKRPNYYWLRLYEDLSVASTEKEDNFLYVDPKFLECSVSILKQIAPESFYSQEDIEKMSIILWATGIGWSTSELLFEFTKFLGKRRGLKKLSKKTITRYLKFLTNIGLVTVEKFNVGKKRVKRYVLIDKTLKACLKDLDYYRVFGI